MEIQQGQKWRLKRNHKKIAKVLAVEITDAERQVGYVRFLAPWMGAAVTGKSLDTFLKYYELDIDKTSVDTD